MKDSMDLTCPPYSFFNFVLTGVVGDVRMRLNKNVLFRGVRYEEVHLESEVTLPEVRAARGGYFRVPQFQVEFCRHHNSNEMREAHVILKIIEKINDLLDKITYWLLACMIGAMSLICFCQVVGRNVVKFSPAWMEESCRFLLIWTSFLGAAAILRKGGHACVSVIVNLFPFQVKRVVAIAVDAIMCVFFGILTYQGVILVERYVYRMAETMPLSMSLVYLCFPVSFGLMTMFSIEEIVRLLVAPESVPKLLVLHEGTDMIQPNE